MRIKKPRIMSEDKFNEMFRTEVELLNGGVEGRVYDKVTGSEVWSYVGGYGEVLRQLKFDFNVVSPRLN